MAEQAINEAAGHLSKISEVKEWINDTLWHIENVRYCSGDNTLEVSEYEFKSDLFEDQC